MVEVIFPDGTYLSAYAKKSMSVISVAAHTAETSPEVSNVVYGTTATPPMAATTTTIGTIYLQYTP